MAFLCYYFKKLNCYLFSNSPQEEALCPTVPGPFPVAGISETTPGPGLNHPLPMAGGLHWDTR
jgi:hypothetical protein